MELTELKNIGPVMNKKLNGIGIHTAEELRKAGSKEVFFRLKCAYPEVCLVHLYSLQGAVDGLGFNELSKSKKEELKAYSDSLKESSDSP